MTPTDNAAPTYGPRDLLHDGEWSAFTPDRYELGLLIVGLAALGAVVFPRLFKRRPISLPIIYVALGLGIFYLPLGFRAPDPLANGAWAERLTELGVIVALTVAGLKLDRPLRWSTAKPTRRLLLVTMPLSIAAAAALGWGALGWPVATALLLGAAIAPTDPVLASDVEVGPPGEGKEDVVRYSLTAEAGLNDGLAFPFVNLAIAVALAGTQPRMWLTGWLLIDVLYRLLAGVGIGWLFGRVLARFVFRIPMGNAVARAMEGSIALAATLIVYGLTELAQGYGFVAVFVAACTLRQSEREHEYHQALHDFAEDIGRLLTAALLLLLGGAIAGGLLANLTWRAAGVAALLVFAVRPITGAVGLLGCTATVGERAAIAFFGIRGIGSFYYLAYALNHAPFARAGELWSLVALTVVISIVVHGVATEPAMRWLDRRRSSLARVPRVACPPVSL